MDDFRSPLSPIDAGLDPGPYPMPDSPSLSAFTEQDLSEARVRGTSNRLHGQEHDGREALAHLLPR